eukprot:6800382-Prymnesium_polylepis.1
MRARRCPEAAPDAENGETSDLKVSAESSRRAGDARALPSVAASGSSSRCHASLSFTLRPT